MRRNQRKQMRLQGKPGAFAAFVMPGEIVNIGHVRDISLGGLCLRYTSTQADSAGCTEIKIFGSDRCFMHVDSVQCRVVYDMEIPKKASDRVNTRHCGVEFQNVSARLTLMIRDFIEEFAVRIPRCRPLPKKRFLLSESPYLYVRGRNRGGSR